MSEKSKLIKFKDLFKQWIWIFLIIFCIVGLFYPIIGTVAVICMLSPVVLAFFRGRMWCGNFCPRGKFNDMILSKVSRRDKIPHFFKTDVFRISFLILIMLAFTIQLFFSWGDPIKVGTVFVRMIIITTLVTIFIGLITHQRSWCTFCPMGIMAYYISKLNVSNKIKYIKFDKDSCVNCTLCSKHCTIGIDVLSHKEQEKVSDPNCLKCNICIEKCPKNALYYE